MRIACLVMTMLSVTFIGCGQRADKEVEWARAALERNPNVEIVSVDEQKRVFTLRLRSGGGLRTVYADELAAGPVDSIGAVRRDAALDARAAGDEAPGAADEASDASLARPGEAASTERAASTEEGTQTAAEASPREAPAYTVERANGRVQISGPGISVTSVGGSAQGGAAQTGAAAGAARGPELQRLDDPIVCDGARFLRLDNRTLEVNGDAIVARDGCELHVSNSRIVATGIGIAALGAKVHVTNSSIEGGSASIEASQGADVYLRASSLKGLSRRLDDATLHDLGGNSFN